MDPKRVALVTKDSMGSDRARWELLVELSVLLALVILKESYLELPPERLSPCKVEAAEQGR
jgi:hypothetical protein